MSVLRSDTVNQLRWDLKADTSKFSILQRALIALRKAHPPSASEAQRKYWKNSRSSMKTKKTSSPSKSTISTGQSRAKPVKPRHSQQRAVETAAPPQWRANGFWLPTAEGLTKRASEPMKAGRQSTFGTRNLDFLPSEKGRQEKGCLGLSPGLPHPSCSHSMPSERGTNSSQANRLPLFKSGPPGSLS